MKKKIEVPEGELPRKPVPKGLERNEAFLEYMSMSRKDREELKQSGIEAPDLSQIENTEDQLAALKEVIEAQLELIKDQQRVVGNFKAVFHYISQTILKVAEEEISPPAALKQITGAILKASGVDPEEKNNEPH